MDGAAQNQLRESWLEQAVIYLADYMATHGLHLSNSPRVSCGFPSRGGERLTIGQCFSPKVCEDGRPQVFVSPRIAESIEVLGILLHELIHAVVGVEAKHGKKFSQAARKVGLVRPWKATTVGVTLRSVLEQFVALYGTYPHAAIQLKAIQLQGLEGTDVPASQPGSRLRLYECNCQPPVKVRVASDHLQAKCLQCKNKFHAVPQASRQNKE